MHPREIFVFSRKKYTAKLATRSDADLRSSQLVKAKKVASERNDVTLHIILLLLTHGGWAIMLALNFRSADVAQCKLGLIKKEIMARQERQASEAAEGLKADIVKALEGIDRSDGDAVTRATTAIILREGRSTDLLGEHSEGETWEAPPSYQVAVQQEEKP